MVILTHKKLAAHRHGNCRKSYDEIAKALKGNNRKDYLFGLKGGKVLSNKIPKGSNRLKIALRNAANAIGNLKETHLSDFFKRVAYRRGRTAAVSATARKLAVIIWNMISKGVAYRPPTEYVFPDQKRKAKVIDKIKRNIAKLELKPDGLGFPTA